MIEEGRLRRLRGTPFILGSYNPAQPKPRGLELRAGYDASGKDVAARHTGNMTEPNCSTDELQAKGAVLVCKTKRDVQGVTLVFSETS